MVHTIIVADDMTGANVSCSLLAKKGIKVGSLIAYNNMEQLKDYEAFGLYTDSRGIKPQEAYTRVYNAVNKMKPVPIDFFSKRIDSTLRGNLGQEIDGMLDALDGDEMAFVVSAFPNSAKIVIGGYMLVDGKPLEKTDVANDPTSPVYTSLVENVLKTQTKYKVGTVKIDTILEGEQAICEAIQQLKAQGVRVVSFDATTNDEIDVIAKAVLSLNIPFIAVDPGPFTAYLVTNLSKKGEVKEKQKILFLIGSVSTIAVSQIAKLRSECNPYVVKIDTEKLLMPNEKETEIQRCVEDVLSHMERSQIFLLATRIDIKDKLDLPSVAQKHGLTVQEASEQISESIAKIGKQITDTAGEKFGAVYTSGGDTTKAFLEITATQGIEIKDEIIPLAVYGTIMGGALDGKSIITKGGLIGDANTLSLCANYLQTKISTKHID